MLKVNNMAKNAAGRNILCLLVAVVLLFTLLVLPALSANLGEGKTDELSFTILYTNDEHSALLPHSLAAGTAPGDVEHFVRGGFARLAAAIDQIREEKQKKNEPVLLFNAGDFLGGAAFGWLALEGFAAEITLLQEMGYDAALIGNHEYDFGPDTLADYLLKAGYPEAHEETVLLASNTRPPKDHPLASRNLYQPDKLFRLENGLKVGVFGLIGEAAVSVAPNTGDIEFLDPHQSAVEAVARLQKQGADVIVAITHSGIEEERRLAREVPDIDVVIGGHCHTVLYEPLREGDTVIVQSGSLGNYLGRLELAYSPNTGSLRVLNEENKRSFLVPIDAQLVPQPRISSLVEGYTAKLDILIKELTQGRFEGILDPVARSEFVISSQSPLQETSAGNFIADAMRLVTEEVTGQRVDVAIQANGNIRGSIAPGSSMDLPGDISLYDITGVTGLGFGDDGYPGFSIVSVYLTGEEIHRVLEVAVLMPKLLGNEFFLQFSGLRYSYNPKNVLLFTVPLINQPVPTTRAVVEAEIYTGQGIQSPGERDYVPLERGDETLYRLVTDTYILSYLPLVGDFLPHLEIVPKNSAGEPVAVENMNELTVPYMGRELKVWEATVEHAAGHPPGEDGLPVVSGVYQEPTGRINQVWSFPLMVWLYLAAAALIAGIIFLIRRRRKKRELF